eukprot:TRINITY_DN11424_c0_g2_i2.p1 TRINITY_DN11424_c0_g2~~TRINITY_DN11424_c0_g2_i2.p1  ORF type:complete len:549 (+),score=49.08 TRINITY_DN11424_c0_g2_i2:109-1647(+)
MRFLRHLLAANPKQRCSSASAVQTVSLLIETHRISRRHSEPPAGDQSVIASASSASAPAAQNMEPGQVVLIEQGSQFGNPRPSDRGPWPLKQEQREPSAVPGEMDDDHRHAAATSRHSDSEVANTHVDDLPDVAPAACMQSQPAKPLALQSMFHTRKEVRMEKDFQSVCPASSSQDSWTVRQECLEPFPVQGETAKDHDSNCAATLKHDESEVTNTHVHDLSVAASAASMRSQPMLLPKDTPNAGRGANALASQGSVEPRQAVSREHDFQVACSSPQRQERIEAFSMPGVPDDDRVSDAVDSKHDSFVAANTQGECAESVHIVPSTSAFEHSPSDASDPRVLLREYRRKFNLKHGISQMISAGKETEKNDCFDSIACCSPSERMSAQSTRCSSVFNFVRRSACKEWKNGEQDEPTDGTKGSQSGSSFRHQASNALKVGRSALRMVRQPFKGNRSSLNNKPSSFDPDDYFGPDNSFDSYSQSTDARWCFESAAPYLHGDTMEEWAGVRHSLTR